MTSPDKSLQTVFHFAMCLVQRVLDTIVHSLVYDLSFRTLYYLERIIHRRSIMGLVLRDVSVITNPEHVEIIRQDVEVWNQWRKEHFDILPDLSTPYRFSPGFGKVTEPDTDTAKNVEDPKS